MPLTYKAALRKHKSTVQMQHRHFAFIAATIASMPDHTATLRAQKISVASTFSAALVSTNPNFDRARFFSAVGVDDPPKLKFKPTPISRLFKYQKPIKMVGDPDWGNPYGKTAWARRERSVYAHMMERKHWPMPWSPETWIKAWQEHKFMSQKEAEKDNATWDYHHENFLAA